MDEYDYIIVGAGSAGCVLAERLSRDSRNRVAVVEAGGTDRRLYIKLPIGYGRTFFDERVNWKFETEPDPACHGRRSYWPRGKVVGGSSSINALVYCRGMPQDFEDWEAAGATGWGWEEVRQQYDRLEHHIAPDGSVTGNGRVAVSDVSDRVHPTNRHFLAAAQETGLDVTGDFNGPQPEGVGYYRITTRNGLRWSAADAFLRPALKRPNVTLITHALTEQVLLRGQRAVGITYRRDGRPHTLCACGEVLLCAGAIGSPQLLQLSGIGPGERLRAHGIEVVQDNPRVGGGLQDHVAVSYFYRASAPTLNNELGPFLGKVRATLAYALRRRGPLSLSVNQCGGFVRADRQSNRIDQQLYFAPATYTTAPSGKRPIINPDKFPGFLISFQPSRPESRGRLDIRSRDPATPPQIRPNYLATDKDVRDVVAGGRLLQSLVKTTALRRLIREPMEPDLEKLDAEGLVEDFRARCGSVYHPVSTCAMGSDPGTSVVDPRLCVHGFASLRVVDASVFPNITSGNTNAPTLMVANRAADMILEDQYRK